MKKLVVSLKERSYFIVMDTSLGELGKYIAAAGLGKRVFIVTNAVVAKKYLSVVTAGCRRNAIAVSTVILPDGEKYKTLATVEKLYAAALKAGVDRSTCVVALGGGVVGDVAGFFAATYLRGLSCIQVPTTLLAMVDSSVGGKTGVDLPDGKNLVGSFHQPKLVWIDPATLVTLPARQLRNGMAEVIKYGVIRDTALFGRLEKMFPAGGMDISAALTSARLSRIIFDCCSIKARIVEKDEFETKGLREILNFGHTFGHAIETATQYRSYLHGEAVALGMAMAARCAMKMGILAPAAARRIQQLIERVGLPIVPVGRMLSPLIIAGLMRRDKKVKEGSVRLILPTGIGSVKAVSFKSDTEIINLCSGGEA
ncbi:MAG: 3-dehydroquinate synthase [Elusimicrobia bacterium]|nr:3-dehydroquinate synthase [Elusimicrobiota bacterium]